MTSTPFRTSIRQAVKVMLLVITMVIAIFLVPTAQAQNGNQAAQPAPDDFTRVYTYNYDDIFQSVQSALLASGWNVNVDETNKDRGFVVATRKATIELNVQEWPPFLPPPTCKKEYKRWKGPNCHTPLGLLKTRVHIEIVKPKQTRVTLELHFRADDTKEDVEVSPATKIFLSNIGSEGLGWWGSKVATSIFDKLGFILSTLG